MVLFGIASLRRMLAAARYTAVESLRTNYICRSYKVSWQRQPTYFTEMKRTTSFSKTTPDVVHLYWSRTLCIFASLPLSLPVMCNLCAGQRFRVICQRFRAPAACSLQLGAWSYIDLLCSEEQATVAFSTWKIIAKTPCTQTASIFRLLSTVR